MEENNPILRQLGRYLSDTLQAELLNGYPYPHVASKALYASIESVVQRTMSGMTITTRGLYYAKYVNEGRRSGEKGIPLDVLLEWIRQRKLELRGNAERSVAFAIQTSIKNHGINPTNFIDEAELKIEKSSFVDDQIEKYMSQFIDGQLQTMFNQLTV